MSPINESAKTNICAQLLRPLNAIPGLPKLLMMIGEFATGRGRFSAAARCYGLVLRIAPSYHFIAHYELGRVLAKAGRVVDAERAFRAALICRPGTAGVLHELGKVLVRLNRLYEADEAFHHALLLNPAQQASYVALARLRLRIADREREIQHRTSLYLGALDVAAKRSEEEGRQRLESISEILKVGLEHQPADPDITFELGRALVHQGKLDEVSELLTQLDRAQHSTHHQLTSSLLFSMGKRLLKERDNQAAQRIFEYLLDRSPLAEGVRLALGESLLKGGKSREALPHLEAAYKLQPSSLQAALGLANCYRNLSRFVDANAILEAIRLETPDNLAINFVQARVWRQLGKMDAALKLLSEILLEQPKNAAAHFERARVLSYLGKQDQAARAVLAAISCDPSQSVFHIELAKILREQGRLTESVNALRRAIQVDKGEPLVEFELAQTLLRAGSTDEAIDYLASFAEKVMSHGGTFCGAAARAVEDAMAGYPSSQELLRQLGHVLIDGGDAPSGIELLKQAHVVAPNDLQSNLSLWQAYSQTQQFTAAHEYSTAILRIFQERREGRETSTADEYLNYGRALRDVGFLTEARGEFESLLRVMPDRYEGYYELARILRSTGDYSAAQAMINEAIARVPQNQTVQKFKLLVDADLKVYGSPSYAVRQPTGVTFLPRNRTSSSVLHVLETSLPHRSSGYTIRSHYILRNQQRLGFRVAAMTRPGFPGLPEVDRETVEDITYYRCHFHGESNYNRMPLDCFLDEYAQAVATIGSAFKPDILHAASNFKNGFAARAAASALGIPWVYELRGLWEDTQVSKGAIDVASERYGFFQRMESKCLNEAHAVVTISHTLKSELCARGIPAEKVFLVPNAVETEKFPVVAKDRALLEKLNLGSGPVVGYISSLVAYEGIEVLLGGFQSFLQSSPDAKLLIVGDGEERARLERMALELELGDVCLFTGRVPHDQILSYYSLIDFFVVPRLPLRVCEIVTPLKPYEAMSTGRVVVVSDVAALREMVIEGVTGVTFKAGDSEHLGQVLAQLQRQPELCSTLAANAAQWVRQERTWAAVATGYRDAYGYADAAWQSAIASISAKAA